MVYLTNARKLAGFFMDNIEIKSLFSKVFRTPYLWAVQSYKRSLFVLFMFVIIGIPIIQYLQDLVKHGSYLEIIASIITFLSSLSPVVHALAVLFTGIFIWLFYLSLVHKKSKIVQDKFEKELNHWAIPLNAGWTIQRCTDRLGRMLSVTNSDFPGTLKASYSWYDYEVSFLAKMDDGVAPERQNFAFIVRSEDNYNGVMFQITKTHVYPHLLYNSTYIKDTENDQRLPTVLSSGDWINVRVVVLGNIVEIYLDRFRASYKIPSLVINYGRSDLLARGSVNLKEIQDVNATVTEKYSRISSILRMAPSPAKEEAMKTIGNIFDEINKDSSGYSVSYSKVLLEYQKGSVGFRESGPEHAFFKDFKIKRI
ncbi:hypothetical protein A2773_05775 [Candidatus Gottesmanbacteria bacterium RIFCSPHIGHO2_01_FULL_39_10]|uniref:3-keto-disaccharide hydrolase domain-containing protein n=1 Tax=Candidatus Gottesmanbacteria bacterium RIFCSPHIGHO2_01_FULL_39_10 TaxID=1798375 RepID=A0A1F5ZNG9_9BACT|nr:MAG: hypothetical protein A2773_05775 [Candidatus Gottesmanbacteria bacterium RIFCSPHIGHO2_01_FULL_39_10]